MKKHTTGKNSQVCLRNKLVVIEDTIFLALERAKKEGLTDQEIKRATVAALARANKPTLTEKEAWQRLDALRENLSKLLNAAEKIGLKDGQIVNQIEEVLDEWTHRNEDN